MEELDYVREGRNATKFAEQMRDDLPQVWGRDDDTRCFAL